MKKIIIILLFLFIALAITFTFLQQSTNDNISKLINNSEIKSRIETIESKINEYKKNNSQNNQYINSFSLNYDKEITIYEVKKSIKDNLTKSEIDELLDWYESDLGKKIKYLNDINITEKLAIELLNDIEPLKNRDRLIRVVKIGDLLQLSNSDYILFSYIMKKTKFHIEDMTLHKKRMRNQTIAYLMYKYKDLSLDDLDRYLNFLESNSAIKFINFYKIALENSLIDTLEISEYKK